MQTATGLNRDSVDKFYTSETTVNTCFSYIIDNININQNDVCIEPSAGNGAFIQNIKKHFNNFYFYDIIPEHNEIHELDFLNYNIHEYMNTDDYGQIHIIGNPPFGRQSSLTIKFIKIITTFADTISFILPRSFKKYSMKKYFPRRYHLVLEENLPDNSFLINDTAYNVPCIFQIWIKKEFDRVIPLKLKPNKFFFVKKANNPDISFRRVGVYAGNIERDYSDKSEQSHYFIKFEEELTEELFEQLSNINFLCKNNTVGPCSISKQELILEFNKILN